MHKNKKEKKNFYCVKVHLMLTAESECPLLEPRKVLSDVGTCFRRKKMKRESFF